VVLVAGLVGLSAAWSQEGGPVVTSLTLFAGTPSGLWRSTNWGGKWDRVLGRSEGVSLAEVGTVRGILPIGRQVYVAAETGLFFSEDFGQTWKKLGLDVPVYTVLPSRYTNADPTVFVGTADGLYKSGDAGKTFTPTVLRGTPVTRIEWPGPALIVTTGHSVLVSQDGAASFTSGAGLPDGTPHGLAVSSFFARDPVLFTAVGSAGVFRSADGGRSWNPAGLEGRSVRDLVWLGPILYAATDEGLFRSDDLGESLDPVNEGFCNRRVLSFATSGKVLFASSATGSATSRILRRKDSGSGWRSLVSGSELLGRQVIKIVPLDDERLYALTTESLLLTADSGRTWAAVPLPAVTSKLTTLLVPPDGDKILVGAEDGVYYSQDAGKTWLQARLPEGQLPIRSLILLGSQSVAAITRSTVLVSRDGTDYEAASSLVGGAEFYGLVATDKALLAATSLGLLRSDDFGASWRAPPGVLNGSTVSAISKHSTYPGVLFASCYGAVFRSLDDGYSWTLLIRGEGEVASIRELVVAAGMPDRLFAITHNQGVLTLYLERESSCPECNGPIADAKK